MSALVRPRIRLLFFLASAAVVSHVDGAEPLVFGPHCSNLFETAIDPEELALDPDFDRSRLARFAPAVGASKITGAARRKDWIRVAEEMNRAGLPVRVDSWQVGGKTYGGVTFDLGDAGKIEEFENITALPEDPLIRAMKRLRFKWNKIEIDAETAKNGRILGAKEIAKAHFERDSRFVKISIVDDLMMPMAKGTYLGGDSPRIFIHMDTFEDYFKSGFFPLTLAHELRHAGFDRFEATRFAGGRNFYGARLRASTGSLSTKGNHYSKFIAAEEPYTHLRDFRARLLKTRTRIAAIAKANLGPLFVAKAKALEWALADIGAWNARVLTLTNGVKSDLAETFGAALSGEAAISIPFGHERISITLEGSERTLQVSLPCPGCGYRIWGRGEKAKEIVETMAKSAELRLEEMKSTLESSSAGLASLENDVKSITGTGTGTTVTGEKILRQYDEVIAKIVAAMKKEPNFGGR